MKALKNAVMATIKVVVWATCGSCNGSGWIGDLVCPGCSGSGQK